MHLCMLSYFSYIWLFATLWTVGFQASLSMGISRQEYWSVLPCPPPGIVLTQGLNLCPLCLLHWQVGSLSLAPPRKPRKASVQFSSVAQSCPTLCDPMNRSTPGLPVHHHSRSSLKLVSIKSVMPSSHLILCRPLLFLPSIFPNARVFFKWVSSLHQAAKVLEFQLQHQSFQWIIRINFL